MEFIAMIVLALLLDTLFGELSRWRPLLGFGRMASYVD